MVLPLLFVLQLQVAADTATYSSPAVRTLVERATEVNAAPDPRLAGYSARVESEIALGYRDTLGIDRITQTEQLATRVRWRGIRYEQTLVGYRSQAVGTSISVLSLTRGWSVPSLHGSTLHLGLLTDTTVDRRTMTGARRQRAPRPRAIHPLATGAGTRYRYSGGDTITVISSAGRAVPIARIRVSPRPPAGDTAILFDGEIDFDAARSEIVRMRGKLVRVDPRNASRGATIARLGFVAVGYVEFVNVEIDGSIWLPSYQRTEIQGSFALTGAARSILRVVSRFTDHALEMREDSTAPPLAYTHHRLIIASSDSLRAFDAWMAPLGDATRAVAAEDFEDLAPRTWMASGPPVPRLRARRMSDVLRFNRVEGLYTGLAGEVDFRDAAPGVVLSGSVGWAWWEGTARGEVTLRRSDGPWAYGVRAGRVLTSTNDFTRSTGPTLISGALGVDDHDYVDRGSLMLGVTRTFDRRGASYLLLEGGAASDRAVQRNVVRGLLSDTAFRANRGVREWDYARGVVTLAVRSDVSGTFLQPGIGTTVRWERGQSGARSFDRVEGSIVGRHHEGPLTLIGRAMAGAVRGDVPPQALFELGGGATLPGYRYKEFTGDAAAAGRAVVMYTTPILRAPIRLTRRYTLPSPSPGFAAGLTAGWTGFHRVEGREAALELGAGTPVPTGSVRTTADFRLTFFNGSASVGVARPLDGSRGWRLVLDLAQPF